MQRKVVAPSLALAAIAGALSGAVAIAAHGDSTAQRKPVRLEVAEVFIEVNATDGDAGLQVNVDSEDWRQLTIRDPRGRPVLDIAGVGRLGSWGLTGMTFESSEPPFEKVPFRRFRARFPAGRYTFSGARIDGRRVTGADRLTHRIPAAPRVLTPARNAVVDPDDLVVTWKPVTRPRGTRIVRYIVIAADARTDREMEMALSPTVTSATIPPTFLRPPGRYAIEVLARERSGNQTITEVPVRTAR
jgi:hypothetical protein